MEALNQEIGNGEALPITVKGMAKAAKLMRFMNEDKGGYKASLSLYLNKPLQEYLNKCFEHDSLNTLLMDALNSTEATDAMNEELAEIDKLMNARCP